MMPSAEVSRLSHKPECAVSMSGRAQPGRILASSCGDGCARSREPKKTLHLSVKGFFEFCYFARKAITCRFHSSLCETVRPWGAPSITTSSLPETAS